MKRIIDGRWVNTEKYNSKILKLEENTRLIFGGREQV